MSWCHCLTGWKSLAEVCKHISSFVTRGENLILIEEYKEMIILSGQI